MSKKEAKKQPKQQEESKSKINFEELIMNNLSGFKMVQDNSGYHFTILNINQKNIDALTQTFQNYKYIESIDLSGNNITEIVQLSQLPYLIRLNVEGNNIKDLKSLANEEAYKSLKYLNAASNKLVELGPIKVPLIQLNLNDNKIEKMDTFDGNPKLRQLYLKRNKIAALTQFQNLPELKELKLSENKIKAIQGIELLTSIQILQLRKNLIEGFDETFPVLENIVHFDIRENKIDKFDEITKLQTLPNLKKLLYKGNPFESKSPNYLLDTINIMVKLEKINNIFVTKQLKEKAFSFAKDKYDREVEQKRLQEEEEKAKEAALAAQQDQ
ncbi:unnamed protein product [Paramecium pentaurelia]|uniref:Leucine rich repeat protein n=1 Tax=Paramecium pentaurelia TaxID=43138 RepID=A0A8S1T4T2_9CILI|nr:unnamed protein product [Paramecium pentaurelia]